MIFIHSHFRTGSTYLYSLFRNKQRYLCYYEPFHESIKSISSDYEKIDSLRNALNHSELGEGFFDIYRKRNFRYRYRYSFPTIYKMTNGKVNYIKRMINYSRELNKIPVFQFNRTFLYFDQFEKLFPGSINMYLRRNPRDQWNSIQELDSFFRYYWIIFGLHSRIFDAYKIGINRLNLTFKSYRTILETTRKISDSVAKEVDYKLFYFYWSISQKVFENSTKVILVDYDNLDIENINQVLNFHDFPGVDLINYKPIQRKKMINIDYEMIELEVERLISTACNLSIAANTNND